MLTIRQIERLWNAGDFARLARELLQGRPENSPRMMLDASHRVPCAAFSLIRIDEYAQSAHPLCRVLIRCLLAAQDVDGGWGDAATTALVLRALTLSKGHGLAVDRGIAFLAMLQRDEGLFPRIPIRRMEGDAATTALVLHHVARIPAARDHLNLASAQKAVLASSEAKELTHLTRALPVFPVRRQAPAPAENRVAVLNAA